MVDKPVAQNNVLATGLERAPLWMDWLGIID